MNVDELLKRVREEVSRRNGGRGTEFARRTVIHRAPVDIGADDSFPPLPELSLQRSFETRKGGYAIKDFTDLQHGEFIRAAYKAILEREPDSPGYLHFMGRLERGESKALVLGLIRYSPEGRRRAVAIRGLRLRFMFERACILPILGYPLRWIVALVRLPRLVVEARQLENEMSRQLEALNEHTSTAHRTLQSALEHSSSSHRESIRRLQGAVVDVRTWTNDADSRLTKAAEDIVGQRRDHQSLTDAVEVQRTEQLSTDAALRDSIAQATTALEAGIGKLTSEVAQLQADERRKREAEEAQAHSLDELYATFEEKFRGERDDIKQRVSVYLPRLLEAGIGSAEMPVVDIGCGRGEWLEVLKERNLHARGVDQNPTTLASCAAKGLDVVQNDGLSYLQALPAQMLGAVTAFHVVEHLTLPYLASLLMETARVLRPGGIAIFETPNPENVLVGSHTFYLDPTHRNPVPAATLKFFVEAIGLRDVEVLYLHPAAEWERIAATDPAVESFVNTRFFGPRDYAVIGRKA